MVLVAERWQFSMERHLMEVIKSCDHLWKSILGTSQVVLVVKNPPATSWDIRERVRSLGREDPLEEDMATHSSILAWRLPWTEEPGGLQSVGW